MTGALEAIFDRPRAVIAIMIAMVVAGIVAYAGVPKEANPDVEVPVYFVRIAHPGIAPADAERLLVRPLETALRGLDGLKELTAIAGEGNATMVLEFSFDTERAAVLAAIRDRLDRARADLPDDAEEPTVSETSFALMPTIVVALSGAVPERTLARLARDLKAEIETVPTVREATVQGAWDELLAVELDVAQLHAHGVTADAVAAALSRNNSAVAAGVHDDGDGRFNVRMPGLIEHAGDLAALVIRQGGDGLVTLGDIADIRRTHEAPSSFTRVNGRPAIAIEVVKRAGANIVANNQAVRAAVAGFSEGWPETVKVDFLLDRSAFIHEVQGSLESSLMTAVVLVMILVIAALGIRSGLLVGMAIPVSFMIGFLIVGMLGMAANMMVMFGLVLTVGMLVDSAIVVTEHADRKIAEGISPEKAYRRAARLMFWPVVSSTATTLAAFLPLLLWPGVPGEFMAYLPRIVIIVLTASLVTALVFLPVLGALLARLRPKVPRADIAALAIPAGGFNARRLRGPGGLYVRFIERAVAGLAGNLAVIGAIAAVTLLVFAHYRDHNAGVEFFIKEEPDKAVVLVSARGNLSAADIDGLVGEVESAVLTIEGIDHVIMRATAPGAQRAGGNPISSVQDKPADLIGELQVELADYCCRRKAEAIFAEIRERTAGLAGLRIEIREIEGGPPTGKDLRLEVTSRDYGAMIDAVARIRGHIDTLDILTEREDGRPLPGIAWRIDVDRAEAARYGADVSSIGAMVRLDTNGLPIGSYRPDDADDEVDIRLRLPEAERTLGQLDRLTLSTPAGQVPLSHFVTRRAEPEIASILRRDGRYAMEVKANLAEGALLDGRAATADDAVRMVEAWLAAQHFPESVAIAFRGADAERKQSQAFLGKAAFGALFLMFVILITQFNSLYQTLLTLSTVMMAVTGVLIGMLATGQTFSIIMTGTGIVALSGIVVNNAIILIDTYNRQRAEGVADPREAVVRAAAERLRPILLTTGTTILGLVPMALEVNLDFLSRTIEIGGITAIWWVQLSTAIIAGLAFSTVLTLVFVPVMLALPPNLRRALRRRDAPAAVAAPEPYVLREAAE